MRARAIRITLKGVPPTRRDAVPSAARGLNEREVADLAAIARALPAGWVVQVQPPRGQVAILPRAYLDGFHRCFVADAAAARIYRQNTVQGRL